MLRQRVALNEEALSNVRSEASVDPINRYLWLAARLSRNAFEKERRLAVHWCSENTGRLEASNRIALQELVECELTDSTVAMVMYGCYADIPSRRAFSAVFDTRDPSVSEETRAQIRFAIYSHRLPVLSLEDGHHSLIVVNFAAELPKLISSLPVLELGQVPASGSVGLCDLDDWNAIREHQKHT